MSYTDDYVIGLAKYVEKKERRREARELWPSTLMPRQPRLELTFPGLTEAWAWIRRKRRSAASSGDDGGGDDAESSVLVYKDERGRSYVHCSLFDDNQRWPDLSSIFADSLRDGGRWFLCMLPSGVFAPHAKSQVSLRLGGTKSSEKIVSATVVEVRVGKGQKQRTAMTKLEIY